MADEAEAATATRDDRSAARMRRAVREIRREGWKVALVYATVDAALATMVSNLALAVYTPPVVPDDLPIPTVVVGVLRRYADVSLADPTVSGGAVVAMGIGLLVFVAEVAGRVRRPLVEQFEAANPGLRESLRTARDAVADGRESRIAVRLYEDVLTELRASSSIGLLNVKRLVATVLLLAVLSAGTVQLAVVDLSVSGVGDLEDGPGTNGDQPAEFGGLQDPSGILGEPEDISEGEATLDTVVGTSGSGGANATDSPAAYDSSGFSGATDFESQQAGFAEGEQLEDAALIREYNLRIREEGDE